MNICIPITREDELSSPISGHFGSAPFFAIIDSDTGAFRSVSNPNRNHEHGGCQPMVALAGQKIDAVVVGGIGAGALSRLQSMGVPVYRAGVNSVSEALQAFASGGLEEITPAMACSVHGHGAHAHVLREGGTHGHGHGHGQGHGGPHGSGRGNQ